MNELVWIFAYGSLMWRPDFPYRHARRTRLHGYHRALCVYSWVHRGTPERPGLVLGLDRGGACVGMAFGIDPEDEPRVLEQVDARELVTAVYTRRRLRLASDEGPLVAWGYVTRREHAQYAGALDVEEVVPIVRHAAGRSGPNADYLLNTVDHLEEMGIRDGLLERAAARLRAEEA